MKVILVAGARPNFMKIAPLLRAITRHNKLNEPNEPNELDEPIHPLLVHTGQQNGCAGEKWPNGECWM